MRILFICHRVPYPPDKGDKIRSYNLLAGLCRRHEVHLAALYDRAAERTCGAGLESLCASVALRRLWPIQARLKSLGSLVGRGALSVLYFSSRGLRRDVAALASRSRFDVALAYSSAMAPYLDLVDCPRVVDLVDVDSEKFRLYAQRRASRLWPLYALEARRLRAFERRVVERVPLSIVCTDDEADLLRSFSDPLRLEVVTNGVDLEHFSFEEVRPEVPSGVFVGAFDYLANAEGAVWFAQEVLPRIRLEIPDFVFRIVGREPTAAVRALGAEPGIEVTGSVADVVPYLRRASVAVAPLKVARGVQNKVLESLSAGTPTVATSEAARGIQAVAGLHLLVADQPEEMARSIVGLVRDPKRACRMAREGRSLVEQRYSWETGRSKLDRIMGEVARTGLPRRFDDIDGHVREERSTRPWAGEERGVLSDGNEERS